MLVHNNPYKFRQFYRNISSIFAPKIAREAECNRLMCAQLLNTWIRRTGAAHCAARHPRNSIPRAWSTPKRIRRGGRDARNRVGKF